MLSLPLHNQSGHELSAQTLFPNSRKIRLRYKCGPYLMLRVPGPHFMASTLDIKIGPFSTHLDHDAFALDTA